MFIIRVVYVCCRLFFRASFVCFSVDCCEAFVFGECLHNLKATVCVCKNRFFLDFSHVWNICLIRGCVDVGELGLSFEMGFISWHCHLVSSSIVVWCFWVKIQCRIVFVSDLRICCLPRTNLMYWASFKFAVCMLWRFHIKMSWYVHFVFNDYRARMLRTFYR